jgi:hypothetical protein
MVELMVSQRTANYSRVSAQCSPISNLAQADFIDQISAPQLARTDHVTL